MATAPKVIRIDLSPAAIVHREKLLLRKLTDLPKNIIQLPSFTFVGPFPQSAPGAEKMMVKGLLQAVSIALLEARERRATDLAFASLAKFSFANGECRFEFQCPYVDIVERVADFKNNKPDPARLDSLKINYKFNLVSDLAIPLVFSLDSESRQLLITNENHVDSPNQFLDPDRCRVTSGFLNFIGTLNMLQVTDAAEETLEAVVQQANRAIGLDVDEWLRWLYCFIDTRTLFDPKGVYLSQQDPERFFIDYH